MATHPEEMRTRYDDLLDIYRLFWRQQEHRDLNFGYFESGEEDSGEATGAMVRELADQGGIGDGDRVLDLGCAAGGGAVRLARRGATVVGVDLNEQFLSLARESAAENGVTDRTTFLQDDFHDLDAVDGPFDVVWTLEALSHSADKRRVFERCGTLLEPGGRLVVGDLFERPDGVAASQQADLDAVEGGLGLSIDRIDDAESALEDAGFVDVEHRDVTEAVLPGARQSARTGRFFGPVASVLQRVGVATEAHVGAFRAWRGVYDLFEADAIGYYFLTARRPSA